MSLEDIYAEVSDQAIEQVRIIFRVWVTVPISQWDECIRSEGSRSRSGRGTQRISRGGRSDWASDHGG